MNTTIRTLVPTYFFMSVDYNGSVAREEALASYRGVVLRVEYNGGVLTAPGPRPEQKIRLFTGDFTQDYSDAVETAAIISDGRDVSFMCSSTLDDFMYDTGLGAHHKDDESALAEADAALEDLPFLPAERGEAVRVVADKLAAVWDTIPAAKLQWALATVIATSRYNTSYPSAPLGRDEALQALGRLSILVGGLA